MHRQINALVSAGSSPGKLAIFGIALGEAGVDIGTIGGAEWHHDAPLSLILKDDSTEQLNAFAGVCDAPRKIPWLVFRTAAVKLSDAPGALGAAAAVVAGPENDINIYSVNVLSARSGEAVVGLGIRPRDVDQAVERLVNNNPAYEAWRLKHPDEPADWKDKWDRRTERLLPKFDEPGIEADDPIFWQVSSEDD